MSATAHPALAAGAPLPGTVTLVGAGPGDPDLLTLKAVKAIRAATLLLVDDLVGADVLAYAQPSARVLHVGKRGGCASTPQAFIDKLMALAAREGEVVVRLKGGDPLIFGRGGEELAYLRSQGIAVQVVNGITAGVAAMGSLGLSLTHRDHAQGVLFITGHAKPGAAAVDWAQVAQAAGQAKLTLVIYMGVTSAALIQAGLLQGLPAHTPLAVIQRASLPQQRQVRATLGDMLEVFSRHQLGSPAVMVVGDVVAGAAAVANENSAAGLCVA